MICWLHTSSNGSHVKERGLGQKDAWAVCCFTRYVYDSLDRLLSMTLVQDDLINGIIVILR